MFSTALYIPHRKINLQFFFIPDANYDLVVTMRFKVLKSKENFKKVNKFDKNFQQDKSKSNEILSLKQAS